MTFQTVIARGHSQLCLCFQFCLQTWYEPENKEENKYSCFFLFEIDLLPAEDKMSQRGFYFHEAVSQIESTERKWWLLVG